MLKVRCIILILASAQSETDPIILEEQGIILNHAGMVALPVEEIQVSLMIKIIKPSLLQTTNCEKETKLNTFVIDYTGICKLKDTKVNSLNPLQQNTEMNEETCKNTCINEPKCIWMMWNHNNCKLFNSKSTFEYHGMDSWNGTCLRENFQRKDQYTNDMITTGLNKEIEIFWEEIRSRLHELDGNIRKKRQIAAILGGGVLLLSLITTGLNFYNNKKLEKRIEDMRIDFQEFAEGVKKFEQNTYDFEKEVLKIIQSIENTQKRNFESLVCQTDRIALALLQYREVDKFKSKAREILKPLDEGLRTGKLNPRLLNISTISNIINQHPKLEETLYANHPALIYQMSKTTIAELTENESKNVFSAHLILTIPLLKPGQILHFFKVVQTGFTYDNKCWNSDVPKEVYQKISIENNKEVKSFYSLDEVHCERQSDLFKYCNLNVTKTSTKPMKIMEVSCLSKEPKDCNMYPVKCTERAIYNIHGLMTRSDHKIKGVLKEITSGKKFITWDPM